MREIVRYADGVLHHIDCRTLYFSRGRRVFVAEFGGSPRVLANLPCVGWLGAAASSSLLARLTRSGIHHVLPFRQAVVVFGMGRIWCLDASGGELIAPPSPIIGSRPLAICASPYGMYYGEYRNNPERSRIRVFFSDDGARWEERWQLNNVRHVHGVFYDPFTGGVWLTTGDEDRESGLWFSRDGTAIPEMVLGGSQQVRAITLQFRSDSVYFGSDTPIEQNYIYRLDRQSGKVERHCPVVGSVFHSCSVGDWLAFSTAVEPSKVNESREAAIYISRGGDSWVLAACHRKDLWSMRYFQYGQLVLPKGNNQTGQLMYSAYATHGGGAIFSGAL